MNPRRGEGAAEAIERALENVGPCDRDNPHQEVWCINHQQKRCTAEADVKAAREALDTLTQALSQAEADVRAFKESALDAQARLTQAEAERDRARTAAGEWREVDRDTQARLAQAEARVKELESGAEAFTAAQFYDQRDRADAAEARAERYEKALERRDELLRECVMAWDHAAWDNERDYFDWEDYTKRVRTEQETPQ